MLTAVFMSGVRFLQFFSSHTIIPGYQQYTTELFATPQARCFLHPVPHRMEGVTFQTPKQLPQDG